MLCMNRIKFGELLTGKADDNPEPSRKQSDCFQACVETRWCGPEQVKLKVKV